MKTKTSLTILLAAMLALTACTKHEETTLAPAAAEVQTGRTIVYAAGHSEGMATLKTEGEWDAMLDRLCSMAAEGNTVTFYNMGARANAKGVTKEEVRFTTGDRQEIKEWMKEREKEGMTVSVSYDEKTGQWSGVAHASAAIRQDHSVFHVQEQRCHEIRLDVLRRQCQGRVQLWDQFDRLLQGN